MKILKKLTLILGIIFSYNAVQGNESVSLSDALQSFDKTVQSIESDKIRMHKLYSGQCSEQILGLIEASHFNIDFNFFLGFFDSKEQPELSVDYLIRHLLLKPFSDCGFYQDSKNRDKLIYDENVSVTFHRSSKRANKLSRGVLNNNRDDSISETTLNSFLHSLRTPRSLNIYIGHSRYGKGLDFYSRKLNFKNSVSFDFIRKTLEDHSNGSLGLGIISCDSSKYASIQNNDPNSIPIYTLNGVFYAQNIMDQVTQALDNLLQKIDKRLSNSLDFKEENLKYNPVVSAKTTLGTLRSGSASMLLPLFTGVDGSYIPAYLRDSYSIALRQIQQKHTSLFSYLFSNDRSTRKSDLKVLSDPKPIEDLLGIYQYPNPDEPTNFFLNPVENIYRTFYIDLQRYSTLVTSSNDSPVSYLGLRYMLTSLPSVHLFMITNVCRLPLETRHIPGTLTTSAELCCLSVHRPNDSSQYVPFLDILSTEQGVKALTSWEALSKTLAKIAYHKAIQHYAKTYETYTKEQFLSYIRETSKYIGINKNTLELISYILDNYYESIFYSINSDLPTSIKYYKSKMQRMKMSPLPADANSSSAVNQKQVEDSSVAASEFIPFSKKDLNSLIRLTRKNAFLITTEEIKVFYPALGKVGVLSRTSADRMTLVYERGSLSFPNESIDDYELLIQNPVLPTAPSAKSTVSANKVKVNARIQAPQAGLFTPVYTDRNNKLSWSKKLPGTYSNGCVNVKGEYDRNKCTFETLPDGSRQVKVDDSKAAIACKKIGARLPTQSEFHSLIRNFDHSIDPRLTAKGIVEMQSVFGDMNNWFWSSSVDSNDSDVAYVLIGSEGGVSVDHRKVKYNAVLCVANR